MLCSVKDTSFAKNSTLYNTHFLNKKPLHFYLQEIISIISFRNSEGSPFNAKSKFKNPKKKKLPV